MKIFLNILWILLGGFLIFLEYMLSSLFLIITLIGIPFGLQTFKMGILALAPFNREVVDCPSSGGCLSIFMNILWLFVGGIYIALSHVVLGILLCVTLIGIPFGKQHFKLALLALTPFGKKVEYSK